MKYVKRHFDSVPVEKELPEELSQYSMQALELMVRLTGLRKNGEDPFGRTQKEFREELEEFVRRGEELEEKYPEFKAIGEY